MNKLNDDFVCLGVKGMEGKGNLKCVQHTHVQQQGEGKGVNVDIQLAESSCQEIYCKCNM